MSELLKRICTFAGIQVTPDFRIHRLFQRNVFGTKYKKKALISYITRPFIMRMDYRHTNLLECFTAAKVLSGLGYDIDVVDCDVDQKVDFAEYDVIYGQGLVMEKSFYGSRNDQIRVMYCSGANPIFSDIETVLKVRECQGRTGHNLLASSRLLPHTLHAQIFLSDAVVVLGGKRTLETFTIYDSESRRYFNLDCFFYDLKKPNKQKNYDAARRNFLWFGSTGALHKGLDILLEIFSQIENCTLHVCGLNKREKNFLSLYGDLLSSQPNIINHGFVDMTSEAFQKLMEICGYVVLPSVSEGGAPSVLNVAANGGLVPIISRNCGLDIADYGWVVDEPTKESFEAAIMQARDISSEQLQSKSIALEEHVRSRYSFEQYQKNLTKILNSIFTAKQ